MWNGYPVKILDGIEVQINDKNCNITPGIQKVFVGSSPNTAKSMNDMDKVVFRDILLKTSFNNRKPSKRRMSGCDKFIKNNLDNDVRRNLILDTKLNGTGIEKIIIPSDIIDIYTRLEVLLCPKLSGHSKTLTEASYVVDEFYKRGEIQNEQQYRNALAKFHTQFLEIPSKIMEQTAFNTRPKIEEHMLFFMDKSTHEERLAQPLQTNKKQFKKLSLFLLGKTVFSMSQIQLINFMS